MAETQGDILDDIAPRVALRDLGADAYNTAIEETLEEITQSTDVRIKRSPRGLYSQDRKETGLISKIELYVPRKEEIIETLRKRVEQYENSSKNIPHNPHHPKLVNKDTLAQINEEIAGMLSRLEFLDEVSIFRPIGTVLGELLGEGLVQKLEERAAIKKSLQDAKAVYETSKGELEAFLSDSPYVTETKTSLPYLRAVTIGPFSPQGPLGVSLTVECRRADSEAYELGLRVATMLKEKLPSLTIALQEEELVMNLDDVTIYSEKKSEKKSK